MKKTKKKEMFFVPSLGKEVTKEELEELNKSQKEVKLKENK